MKKLRYIIFLRDIWQLSMTAWGGPQAHITMFLRILVEKRAYINEKDFLDLIALCQILPGPTSTQIVTSLGFRLGGAKLAYLTLLVWSFPGCFLMTLIGLLFVYFDEMKISLEFMRFVQPVMIGLVCYSALNLTTKVVNTKTGIFLVIFSTLCSIFFRSPWVFPLVVVGGGLVTSLKFKKQEKHHEKRIKIQWANFFLFWSVLIFAAILGYITGALPIRLFENFYRNGSFIYGGGQVLIPVLLTEFVQVKKYLSEQEFLSGFGLSQFIPGPVFSFVAFIGVLSMREYTIFGQIFGAIMACAGVFLPGTFIIFFVIRFWDELKKIRAVKASLEGINASASGLAIGGAFLLLLPIIDNYLYILITLVTFLVLQFTKIPIPLLILGALLSGFF
ncbi:MAG: chromate efflux transporter [Bacteroidetes bacterium]|nr:MAG: chromate efflux transporter [Bacteroidota bacterium]TAG90044.1 MAG: chromate efflux transporter [Bacteroidota bacterium]